MHGGKHVFGDGVDCAAADGRARGAAFTARFWSRSCGGNEHGNVVAAVSVNRDLVLGNAVVARQPATLAPCLTSRP